MQRIVVPLDRSELAERALPPAEVLARELGAVLRLVYAPRTLPAYTELAVLQQELTEDRDAGVAYLERLAADIRARAALEVETALIGAPVAEAICDDARAADAALVVMSTHGRTGWSRAWIGSVADAVVRHCAVPVLLVRAGAEGEAAPNLAAGLRVLVPLDGGAFAEQALGPTLALLGPLGASYLLLRVATPVVTADYGSAVGMPPLFTPDEEATEQSLRAAHDYLVEAAARLRALVPRAHVELRAVVGEVPARVIVDTANEVDVVAMATHGRGASRLVLGSVADKVLRGARASLLLVRPPAEGGAFTLPAARQGEATRTPSAIASDG